MNKDLKLPLFDTEGNQNERKAKVVGEHYRRNRVEYDPHYVRYELVLFIVINSISKGDPLVQVSWAG